MDPVRRIVVVSSTNLPFQVRLIPRDTFEAERDRGKGLLRAFDVETGKELWQDRLPAGGNATPMTYRLAGATRQYVVIAAGGHGKLGTRRGDSVVAYALPREDDRPR